VLGPIPETLLSQAPPATEEEMTELQMGRPRPFEPLFTLKKLPRGLFGEEGLVPEGAFQNFLRQLLRYDPQGRLDVEQALVHPFITGL